MTERDTAASALFDPIPGDPLADRAADQIEIHILNGLLRDGEKLPGERDLAVQLDVSRPKLREALKLLEDRGLIRIVSGEGAYVEQLSGPALSPALLALFTRHPTARQDHLEYRRHQEGFAARLAAERATSADHARLSDIVVQMRAARDARDEQAEADLDIAFHTAIVEAGYNRMLIHTMATLHSLTRDAIFLSRSDLFSCQTVAEALLAQHEGLAAAILAGDGDRAETLAHQHIDFVRTALEDAAALRERSLVAAKRGVR